MTCSSTDLTLGTLVGEAETLRNQLSAEHAP